MMHLKNTASCLAWSGRSDNHWLPLLLLCRACFKRKGFCISHPKRLCPWICWRKRICPVSNITRLTLWGARTHNGGNPLSFHGSLGSENVSQPLCLPLQEGKSVIRHSHEIQKTCWGFRSSHLVLHLWALQKPNQYSGFWNVIFQNARNQST